MEFKSATNLKAIQINQNVNHSKQSPVWDVAEYGGGTAQSESIFKKTFMWQLGIAIFPFTWALTDHL